MTLSTKSASEIRGDLLAKREIALLDVREEGPHACGHPLFAANLPLSRLELESYTRIPRFNAPIVVFDDGEGLAAEAASRLEGLGYIDVRLLEDGLQGWRNAGFELFRDVNAPSKAFGELVEVKRHTPSLSAREVKALIDAGTDLVMVDVRRFEEFNTMSIPTAISVPGAELVLRIRELAPRPETRVIVNCAGRTRSIIGTQSLINGGLPNPVAALRNGTIGWTLANQVLHHGESRRFGPVTDATRAAAARSALQVAAKAGVERTDLRTVSCWLEKGDITVYRFDVRTPEEYESGHLPGFRCAPGGQLVQETDVYAPVRGARIVLADDDGTRANMTASWLAQMGWQVFVADGLDRKEFTERGPWQAPLPPLPDLPGDALLSPERLHELLSGETPAPVVVLDFAPSPHYARTHIPGAWFALRSQLADVLKRLPQAENYIFTSPDGVAARFAWADAAALTKHATSVLDGGTGAWISAGLHTANSDSRYASRPIDRYRRPYEGTDASRDAMQAYLDWESGLVGQLERDGTHGFQVIEFSAGKA